MGGWGMGRGGGVLVGALECMCIAAYVGIYMHTNAYILNAHTHTHTRTHARTHARTHIICIPTRARIHMHTRREAGALLS